MHEHIGANRHRRCDGSLGEATQAWVLPEDKKDVVRVDWTGERVVQIEVSRRYAILGNDVVRNEFLCYQPKRCDAGRRCRGQRRVRCRKERSPHAGWIANLADRTLHLDGCALRSRSSESRFVLPAEGRAGSLLYHVGKFMGDESASALRLRFELTLPKKHVPPDSERACAQSLAQCGGSCVAVHTHLTEVLAKAGLHERAH
jgi:hypothetical protein